MKFIFLADYDLPDFPFLIFQPGVPRACIVIPIVTNDRVEPRENFFANLSIGALTMRVVLDPAQTQIDIVDADGEYRLH